ncbi:MAG: H-type lectin domain-containing protein [Chloroflexota bacterium]
MDNKKRNWLMWVLPSPGNILFTLLLVSSVYWVQNSSAVTHEASSLSTTSAVTESVTAEITTDTTTTISYQGHLANLDGTPISGTQAMSFNLYAEENGGVSLWAENQTITIQEGLFDVLLGSITPLAQSVFTENDILYLGITIDTGTEMSPRVRLGRVSHAVYAEIALSVPDASITADKLALGSVTTDTLAAGSVTQEKLGADIQLPVIESGEVERSANNEGWTLHEGSGHRRYTETITFTKSFLEMPNIVVSLSQFNYNDGTSVKLFVKEYNVTTTGFDLVFGTWSDTQVTRAEAQWIAYTAP